MEKMYLILDHYFGTQRKNHNEEIRQLFLCFRHFQWQIENIKQTDIFNNGCDKNICWIKTL